MDRLLDKLVNFPPKLNIVKTEDVTVYAPFLESDFLTHAHISCTQACVQAHLYVRHTHMCVCAHIRMYTHAARMPRVSWLMSTSWKKVWPRTLFGEEKKKKQTAHLRNLTQAHTHTHTQTHTHTTHTHSHTPTRTITSHLCSIVLCLSSSSWRIRPKAGRRPFFFNAVSQFRGSWQFRDDVRWDRSVMCVWTCCGEK